MWDEDYRLSQKLAEEAAAALRSGASAQARELYGRAADKAAAALSGLPRGRSRTQQILATRTITLLIESGNVSAAVSRAAEWYPRLAGWLQDDVERAFAGVASGAGHELVIACLVERHRQVQTCPIDIGRAKR